MPNDSLYALIHILVIGGTGLLAFAVYPAYRITRLSSYTGASWRVLFYLILFLIACYIGFNSLMVTQLGYSLLVVASVFFAGACFVLLVTRKSLATNYRIRDMANEEHYRAMHDGLTALPNRLLFSEQIERALLKGKASGKGLAIFVMDLDRFKEINDTLGHYLGDRLLKQVAPRLRDELDNHETIARLGGDEFGVLLPEIADAQQATATAQRILTALEDSFWVEGHHLDISISIGITLFPEHGLTGEQLLQKADVAMYLAKQRNKGFTVYDPNQDQHSLGRLALLGDLREAIDRHALELYYQPQVDARNGGVTSVEALLRWNHPQRGLIPCVDFIGLAEQTGIIKPLTQWVLDNVLRQCAQWRAAGIDLTVAINLSVKNFQEPHLVESITHSLQKWGVPASQLRLEIVESAMMQEPLQVRTIIENLNALGVLISIDDFGTGYSSLSHLRQLPVDEIKIDQSFVTGMVEHEDSAVIVRAIIDLAHNLGCHVIAEGVEDQDSLDLLVILGCDLVQGHFLSKPLPADTLLDWLKSSPRYLPQPPWMQELTS